MSETTKTTKTSVFSLKNSILFFLVAALAIYIFAWDYAKSMYLNHVSSDSTEFVQIPNGQNFDQVTAMLVSSGIVTDEPNFRWLAEKMKYAKNPMRAGRFKIESGWSYKQLISHLRNGEQATVKVVLNNERLLEDVAGKVSRSVEADSLSFLTYFMDEKRLDSLGLNKNTLMTLFIPDTYNMYWTTTPAQFVARMKKEHDAFWAKNDRLNKAKTLNLSPEQVYSLASIVERETNNKEEKPIIAGVYLNRLRIGMKLQADPTAVFATRDFLTHRVTLAHTTFDSPFNTYMYAGLPPGPISMASIPSLDAVLNAETHKYLYFCAKADNSATHAFAETLSAHNENAHRFQAWMNARGILK
jgi:UPF0755 protein